MHGENNVKRGQIRGWLFEAVLRILLEKSGFDMVRPGPANEGRVRMLRRHFVEIKGRGDWHQIDLRLSGQHALFIPGPPAGGGQIP